VFLKFRPSPHGFIKLVIKSIMHTKYNFFNANYAIFFLYFSFFVTIKNANMIFLKTLDNMQLKPLDN
jgi:hypothetical protein